MPERLATYDPATRTRTPLLGDERESGSVLGLAWGPPPGIAVQDRDIYFLRLNRDGSRLAFASGDYPFARPEIWQIESLF